MELLLPPLPGGVFYSIHNLVETTGTESPVAEEDTSELKNPEVKNPGGYYESADLDSIQKENKPYPLKDEKATAEMESQRKVENSEKENFRTWWQMDWKNLMIVIWITGMLAMTLFYLEQFLRLKRCVKTAVRTEASVWESERIDVPFVMPGITAEIYLPVGLEGRKRADILAHERQHIRIWIHGLRYWQFSLQG